MVFKKRWRVCESKRRTTEMNKLANMLEKDGLIDKSKPFKIEVRDGELIINGIKQARRLMKDIKTTLS
jgi:hypothetical protein